jgi:uncharacterized protein (TIGR03435 family)
MRKVALFSLLTAAVAFAQQPKFEIVDVHPSATAPGFAQNFGGVLREGRYVNRDTTLVKLIAAAYGVPEDNVAGGPGWLSFDLFDVVAKVPDGTTVATANLMLRSLLTDRFGLAVHEGMHPVPRYILTVGKGGPKLKPAGDGSDAALCKPKQQSPAAPPSDLASTPDIQMACHNFTASGIAQQLHDMAGGYLDRDVVDTTNLEGSWDFDLVWTPRAALTAKGPDGISIFDAVEKQLGLKLELKDVPMPSLVVDHVNRNPTENPAGVATALAVPAARFEAASIKLANPDQPPFMGIIYTGGSQIRAGGTLRFLIALALQVSPNVADDMVVGLPKSADSQRWEILAKVPSTGEGAPQVVNGRPLPPPLSIALEMLRGELVDQFELKTHIETREVTVYALTLAGNKPKFMQADDSERSGCKPDQNAPKPATNVTTMIACKNTTMAQLAQDLQQMANAYIDHPVVDATGLPGGWDFLMGWTPKSILQPAAPNPNQPEIATDPSGISVFEAMGRELGLKLVKQKKSIPVIAVDHVDEKPVE